jgi:hypothetical protein
MPVVGEHHMAKTQATTTPASSEPAKSAKKAKRNIRAELDTIAEGPIKARVETLFASYLDDKQAAKDSKKKLFAGLDFAKL